jgi:D-3-phosphoglycerate dehydrogenase
MKVAVVEGIRPTLMPEGPQIERRILGQDVEVNWYGLIKPKEYVSILKDVDAVIVRPGTQFSKEMVLALEKARVIVSLGVGYDHISIDTAREKGIPVCNVPDYGTEEVADSTVAMLLAHQRKIFLFRHHINSNPISWDWRINKPITRTRQMQVGIIGLGRIGMAVAIRLKAFGYTIGFYDPYLPRGVEKALGLNRFHKMEPLLTSSDILSTHTPLTEETRGMIDERFLELLKPRAILINTARGGIFKNADILFNHFKNRSEFRIGSDVWPDEPPTNHPLLDVWKNRESWLGDRLILCPHSAFYSEEAVCEIRSFAAEVVKSVLSGGKPYNIVNGVNV